jgi:hypothetical protein
MASEVLCGSCGTALDRRSAACPNCGAQGAPWKRTKSPILAAALAIVPGLGHIYLGHYLKGLGLMIAAGGLEFIGLDLDLTVVLVPLGIPVGLGGVALWVYGMVDAYRIARRMQRES